MLSPQAFRRRACVQVFRAKSHLRACRLASRGCAPPFANGSCGVTKCRRSRNSKAPDFTGTANGALDVHRFAREVRERHRFRERTLRKPRAASPARLPGTTAPRVPSPACDAKRTRDTLSTSAKRIRSTPRSTTSSTRRRKARKKSAASRTSRCAAVRDRIRLPDLSERECDEGGDYEGEEIGGASTC